MKFTRFSRTQACPTCQSRDIYRLKRQGIANRLVCRFSHYRPHWCANCDTFFYAPKHARSVRIEGSYRIAGQTDARSKRAEPGGLSH